MRDNLKFKNGKFVERTPEEAKRLAEYFKDNSVSKPKTPKRTEPFVQVTMKQLDLLIPNLSKSPAASIFFILCHESFRHRGAAIEWPSKFLTERGGINIRSQQRVIRMLEKSGLIAVQRVHRKPPVVRVL